MSRSPVCHGTHRLTAVPGFASLLMLALALGCAGDPELQQGIDRVFESSRQNVYPNGEAVPWEVGQWVLVRTQQAKSETVFRLFGADPKPVGYRRFTVARKEGDGYWLEAESVTAKGILRFAVLISGYDPEALDRLRVTRLKLETADGVVEEVALDDSRAQEVRSRIERPMSTLQFVGRNGRTRNLEVPAGRFVDTRAVPISVSTILGPQRGHVWYSNAVPIVYYAKLTTTAVTARWFETKEIIEVVDFGLSGGESRMFQ